MTPDLASLDQDSSQAKALVSEIIARHASGLVLDAESILRAHPDLKQFPSVVVDLAYEEFCRRLDAGEPIEAEEFARRFPAVTSPLLKLLEVHAYLDQHPDAFGTGPEVVWPDPGDEVAGFRLEREIGRGGFSRVYLARERDLGDRQVVLKICIRANEEAARLGQLVHPHIVPVHSVQFASYPPFALICMPFLGTTTLADVVEQVFAEGRTQPSSSDLTKVIERVRGQASVLSSDQNADVERSVESWQRGTYADFILRKGAELSDALAYAHRLKVWHCDVKPSNVLLATDGRALLLDFNLAVRHDHNEGVIGGTLPYMAPEQLQCLAGGDRPAIPIDHRTDLYALGVTMFQLLTGRLPFPTSHLAENRNQAARQLLERQRARRDWCGELEGIVSPHVARSIGGCLAFDPQQRPDSADAVAQQFRRELATGARVRRWMRRHRWSLSIAAVFLLVFALIFSIGMSYGTPTHLRQYQLGVEYMDAGDFARANRCFDIAIEHGRDFREAVIMRGWSDLLAARREGLEDAERAELLRSAGEYFREASRHKDGGESAASLAQCFAEMGNHIDARTWFQNALERGYATAGSANNLGHCLLKSKQLELAAETLSEAIQLDPTLSEAHRNLLEVRCRLVQHGMLRVLGARKASKQDIVQHEQAGVKLQLQLALDQIKVMRHFAPQTPELELWAANVFALTIASEAFDSKERTDEQVRDFFEQLLASCETGIRLNVPIEELKKLETLAPQLNEDTRFQRLLKSTPPHAIELPIKTLVDIFPEVRSRLTATSPEA